MHTARVRSPFFANTVKAAVQDSRERDQFRRTHGSTLRMLMFGKPGAGKGTLSSRLVKKYDILSLSTGDLLRQHILDKYGYPPPPLLSVY
jgi:nucleoside-triphosphate--adenylate kinase